jgi:phosphatidate cytidylyltransferase
MNMTRVAAGAVLIPIVFVVVWFLPPMAFVALAAAAASVGQVELGIMARARGARPLTATGAVLGVLLIVNISRPLFPMTGGLVFWITLSVLAVLTVRLFSRRPVEGAIEDVSFTLLGILYVALLFGFQVAIHAGTSGKHWLLFLYLVIWASDTGAYYVGTAYGRHRLYEKVSPKKSIEGLVGGTAAAMLAALLCKLWLVRDLGTTEALLLGAGLALVGTAGDLSESLLKRGTGVKDSGTLIPGHGGILDRMDSMLFAAPVLFYYLRMR